MRIVAYCYRSAEALPPCLEGFALPIAQLYVDEERPAAPGFRPERDRLLSDLQALPADGVMLEELAALGDSPEEVRHWVLALAAAGAALVAADGSPLPVDVLLQGADLGDRQRRRRLRQGHARRRLLGQPPPGKPPYGYRHGQGKYLIDRATAPVVTAFVNEFLLYGSLRGAVRFIEGRYGKRISASTGRRWLTQPVYRGDLHYGDGTTLRDTHAAIISREEGAQIDRLLRRNRPLPPRTAGAARSLAGLVTCQACGQPLTVSKTTRRGRGVEYLYLRPAGCPQRPRCRAIAYDVALQRVVDRICQDLPPAVAQFTTGAGAEAPAPGAALRQAIAAKEAAIAQLPQLEAADILDGQTAALRRYRLQGDIADLHQQLAQLPPVNLRELAQSVSIPQFWLDLSEAERRFFFREFLRTIYIVRQGDDWQVALGLVF